MGSRRVLPDGIIGHDNDPPHAGVLDAALVAFSRASTNSFVDATKEFVLGSPKARTQGGSDMAEKAGRPRTSGPTDAELAILRVLWDRGPSTVREVHKALIGSQG